MQRSSNFAYVTAFERTKNKSPVRSFLIKNIKDKLFPGATIQVSRYLSHNIVPSWPGGKYKKRLMAPESVELVPIFI
jgi:hypothetical protein